VLLPRFQAGVSFTHLKKRAGSLELSCPVQKDELHPADRFEILRNFLRKAGFRPKNNDD
jgi:hypothetical protein